MADFTAAHPRHSPSYGRRRSAANEGLATTVVGENSPADRAQMYDRALRPSQYAATTRRRKGAGAGSGSIHGFPTGGMLSSSIHQSAIGGIASAQTVVLGDSQGSEVLKPVSRPNECPSDEDAVVEGGVGSGLGGSYVDGAKPSRANFTSTEDEDGPLEDGVLGLLAQIYGARGGLPT